MDTPGITEQITFLYTADLNATANFYETILGLDLALDQRACRIYKTAPGAYLGFCQREAVLDDHPDIILTLVSTEVEGWYQELVRQEVPIDKPPAINPKFNIYHFFFRDPNGYLIEIQKFLDPGWAGYVDSN